LSRDLAEIFNIIDEETKKANEAPAMKAIQKGVVLGLANHVLIARDGTEIPIDDTAAPIRDDKGNIGGAVLIFRDTTERMRAQEALQDSYRLLEERFITRILESIPSSVLVIDRALRVVLANRNFLEKSRREVQDTMGRKIEEVFPQVLMEYARLDQKVREVFHTGQPIEGGKVAYRAPGLPTRIYYYRLIPLKAEEDTVENVMLLMDDITEREKLGEDVRRAERHLASVVDSAHDLVASMDPEGKILTWNRAAERTSGFESEEVRGQYLPNLCSEEEKQKMGSWLAQLAKGQFTKKSIEINLMTKGGKEIPISWTGSRMLDDGRRIVGLVAVGRDLTERKRLEAQLIQSAKLSSLGVMAGGIAHEIRNPLAISSAAAQLLLERADDEKFREEAAEKIYSGIQRASYIIENLLKFARPPEERMVPMDINETLEETLSLLANQLRVQRVELRKDLAFDLPLVVGNKSLLQQVFSNMILNACNSMPDGGSLIITTRVGSDKKLEIQFADTGVGIPTEHLSKIFDPFFTTMPVGKGIGLGLSISYSIVQQHQGTIEVVSQVDQGTIFTVRLPGNK
jgi:PAS domain S-box-containing protein